VAMGSAPLAISVQSIGNMIGPPVVNADIGGGDEPWNVRSKALSCDPVKVARRPD
jgi:hypothetical protein